MEQKAVKFDDLDSQMRIYETAADYCVLPGIYIAARIDGRNFTRLTKETAKFEAPFDDKFRDLMIETTKHLMNCGFKVIYGYTQSDEISLLFDPAIDVFARKLRKYNSILAGEASAKFTLLFGNIGVFDCRISQLPNEKAVIDYFRWRSEDAHRNALNAHCYWTLRKNGKDKNEAAEFIEHKTVPEKNELLYTYGINFNYLPNWQKRGVGLYWEKTESNKLIINNDLPMREEYSAFIQKLLEEKQ